MFVFKNIDLSSTLVERNVVNYTHNFETSSAGIKSINIVSGSSDLSGSYWDSLNVLFYPSGSPVYSGEHKYGAPSNNLAIDNKTGTQYLHKFHGYPSSSLISIPQLYYGDKIKERTLTITDKSFTDNNGANPIIKDDGFGNLYSTNAYHSQSITAESSSDNYIGNIFYKQGLILITETGSWSGSVKYSDITKDTNFIISLDSEHEIVTYEYSLTVRPEEFNNTMNYSIRMPLSGTFSNLAELTSSIQKNSYIASEYDSDEFNPYITTFNLYQKGDYDTPVMIARLPKPIKKSNKIPITFKIRLDL